MLTARFFGEEKMRKPLRGLVGEAGGVVTAREGAGAGGGGAGGTLKWIEKARLSEQTLRREQRSISVPQRVEEETNSSNSFLSEIFCPSSRTAASTR